MRYTGSWLQSANTLQKYVCVLEYNFLVINCDFWGPIGWHGPSKGNHRGAVNDLSAGWLKVCEQTLSWNLTSNSWPWCRVYWIKVSKPYVKVQSSHALQSYACFRSVPSSVTSAASQHIHSSRNTEFSGRSQKLQYLCFIYLKTLDRIMVQNPPMSSQLWRMIWN